METTIRQKIFGSIDLILLFGRGLRNFSGTKQEAFRSFLIPLALFPVGLAISCLYPPKGLEDVATARLIAMLSIQSVVSFALTVLVIYQAAKHLGAREKFWLAFSAGNWTTLVISALMLPLAICAAAEILPRDQADRIFAITTCYCYIVSACILWRALGINWQLAGALAIATLFIKQETWHLVFWFSGIALPW